MDTPKYFKVRITAAYSEDVWYTDQIGKVVVVFEHYPNPWGYECKKNGFSIFRHDCERVVAQPKPRISPQGNLRYQRVAG